MSDKDKHERMALLAFISRLGFNYSKEKEWKDSNEWKEFKGSIRKSIRGLEEIKELERKLIESRKLIIEEAKKRKCDISKLIDYLLNRPEELFKLLKKKDYRLGKKVKEIIEEGLVKISIPSLEQKFAITKYQLSLFDEIEDKKLVKKAEDLDIKIIGWNLSKAEDQAIFSIQKIYSKYNYIGNCENGNALKFTPAEFYENFGVKKYIYKNKEIFSSAEKNQAYMSLINLSRIQCIMAYNIRDSKTKKFTRVEILSTIIPEIDFLYTGLDKKELDNGKKKKEKLKYIKIIPSKVLLDQIEKNYYALLPSNLYLEIKDKFPKVKNKHLPLFIQWLAKTIALKKRRGEVNITEISFEKLSRLLRMDNWIKARRSKRVDERLKDCFKQSKILGYLNWYKIGTGKTITRKVTLSINIDKFKSVRQIKEIIDGDYVEEENIKEVKKIEDSEIVKKQKERIRAALGLPKK